MHRIANVALVALAFVVLGLAGYVLVHREPAPRSVAATLVPAGPMASTAVAAPAPSPSSAAGSAARGSSAGGSSAGGSAAGGSAAASAVGTAATPARVIAFLGDDWTAGSGAARPAARFTTLVSKRLGLQERNFGADGSGYAKSGPDAGPYRSRIDEVVAAHPDVVVVSGGRNDRADDPATAAARARALFATLRARLPDAELIAVAPWWGDSPAPDVLGDLAKAVRAGVTAAGGTYLDLADPLLGHPEYMADDADPNDRGYAAIADALAPRLEVAAAR